MKRKTILEIISSLLIFLFIYTAASKLMNFSSFRQTISQSAISSYSNTAFAALAFPITEGLVAILLLLPGTRLWGFYGSSVLLSAFTALMIFTNPPLSCPCGGLLKQMTWTQHFAFNAVFLLLSIAGLIMQRRQLQEKTGIATTPVVFT